MFRTVVTAAILALASMAGAVERVEIVLDASSSMWVIPDDGQPLYVTVRQALLDYAAQSAERQGRPEIALRTVGGQRPLAAGDWCSDTRLVLPFSLVTPASCFEALADIVPQGGRPLVRALEAALEDVADAPGRRRIVIISAGSDHCGGNVIEALSAISEAVEPTEVRIIGLGLDRETANAAGILAPTRNLFDPSLLPESLKWALEPTDTRPPVAAKIDLRVTLNGAPPESAEIELTDTTGTERAYAAVEDGRAEVRLAPGRYRGSLQTGDGPAREISGLVVGTTATVALDLLELPPVTLEIVPDPPVAGSAVSIAYWGAPVGETWVALVVPGAPSDSYLLRRRTEGVTGEVVLDLPDAIYELEARVISELQPGLYQGLGGVRFQSSRQTARIEAPDSVENATELAISWTGPGNAHDHITLARRGAPETDHLVCVLAGDESGTASVPAPSDTGTFDLFYRSKNGHIMDRHAVEVFEILATLEGPARAAQGREFSITWTGPDAELDYICVSPKDSSDDVYLGWVPSSDGSPARLTAPDQPGDYEVRYVRSADGVVLARHPIEVRAEEIVLRAPRSVAAGTRFTVRWRGSSGARDFIAVAEAGSDTRAKLDFAFASDGSPVSLAAPFEPGDYEVRYISGSNLEVVVRLPLKVRPRP